MEDKNFQLRGFDDVDPASADGETPPFSADSPKAEAQNPEPTPERYNQQYEYSYTPPKSFFGDGGNYGNYGYGNYGGYGYGNSGSRSHDIRPPAPTPVKEPVKFKPAKERKPIGSAALVACMLICALLGGVAGAGGFAWYTQNGGILLPTSSAAGSSDGPAKNITIEDTAENIAAAVSEKVSPSVVGIRTTASSLVGFWGFTRESTGEGSGIIYSADGYIITNYHVIQQAVESTNQAGAKVEVFLPSDVTEAIAASVVGYDISSDLAVIKIDRTGLPAIEIGDSDRLKVGQTVVAVGNPGGLEFMGSVSAGIISGLNRVIQLENTGDMKLIQTDAAINPGNSGGALVDAKGRLIGVNSAKMAADGFEGMGFAIPVNNVVEICQKIIDNKDEKKAYFGLQISTAYDSAALQRMGYPAGVVISGVVAGGPCDGSGIQRGDILTKIDDTAVTSFSEYNRVRAKYKPNQKVRLTVFRNNRYYTVEITLGESNS